MEWGWKQFIETKAADRNNLVAWKNVLGLFHSKYGKGRDTHHLKDQWKRLQIQPKKTHSSHKAATSMTGGGKRSPPIPNLLERVMHMCPLDFVPRHNPLDSDRNERDSSSCLYFSQSFWHISTRARSRSSIFFLLSRTDLTLVSNSTLCFKAWQLYSMVNPWTTGSWSRSQIKQKWER